MNSASKIFGFRKFAELVNVLGTSTKTNDKLEALSSFFATADDRDKVWVIAIFSGRRPKRTIKTAMMVRWCMDITGLPDWLFAESYHTVGDLGETIALLIPGSENRNEEPLSLHHYLFELSLLSQKDESAQEHFIKSSWLKMSKDERFVFNKLITGNFRIGVSQQMMVNALAATLNQPASQIAHRISGQWDPFDTEFADLLGGDPLQKDLSKPYPFYLAYALDGEPHEIGEPGEWQAEWKWDGIRGQVIQRENRLFVWSRGEELITDKFPEFSVFKDLLPSGTVLDGEIICMENHEDSWKPLPFALLQTRIGRKNLTRKHLKESPVGFIAYDLLEWEGVDYRDRPLSERREKLEMITGHVKQDILRSSPVLKFETWANLAANRVVARENGSEGLMLKRLSSTYQAGRKRGDWYKWKIDPLTIDGVMIYAQKGHGRRSNLFTDYTFAVRDGDKLVSFAKAYSGLTDKEFAEVDAFVKRN
ncbi:MAG TPA: ATP-dependent DNA ligase, partial [Chitinophagaceae bacterium]|nr:ATP-dependent DNA ligase [Chitinophagaceae bacterium]